MKYKYWMSRSLSDKAVWPKSVVNEGVFCFQGKCFEPVFSHKHNNTPIFVPYFTLPPICDGLNWFWLLWTYSLLKRLVFVIYLTVYNTNKRLNKSTNHEPTIQRINALYEFSQIKTHKSRTKFVYLHSFLEKDKF